MTAAVSEGRALTRRHAIAVAVAIVAMLIALAPPVWVRTTGTDVALPLQPVDPLSLFRGNYVDLRYDVDAQPSFPAEFGETVYVTFETASRPAAVVGVSDSVPSLGPGQVCVRGRYESSDRIGFPELEQFFVTADEGRTLERDLADMVGIVRATDSCRALLVDIEPE